MTEAPRRLVEELDELKGRLLMMSGLVEARLHNVLGALVERQQDVLADAVSGDARIDTAQHEIDKRCLVMLAVHQPVARPSMVTTCCPSHAAASVKHDRTRWPSMMTVHAPHAP